MEEIFNKNVGDAEEFGNEEMEISEEKRRVLRSREKVGFE